MMRMSTASRAAAASLSRYDRSLPTSSAAAVIKWLLVPALVQPVVGPVWYRCEFGAQ